MAGEPGSTSWCVRTVKGKSSTTATALIIPSHTNRSVTSFIMAHPPFQYFCSYRGSVVLIANEFSVLKLLIFVFKVHVFGFFQLTEDRFLACPGDCEMSEWSSWGPCHRPCTPVGNEGMCFNTRGIPVLWTSRVSAISDWCKCPRVLLWC